MKKILIYGLIIGVMFGSIIYINTDFTTPTNSDSQTRFQETGEVFIIGRWQAIVTKDTETNVLYLQTNVGGAEHGLCPLLDSDGKPMKEVD